MPQEVRARTQEAVYYALRKAKSFGPMEPWMSPQWYFDVVIAFDEPAKILQRYLPENEYDKVLKTIYVALVEHGYM